MFDPLRILKNKVVLFTSSRYLGFGLQFARGILAAKFLGPELFGVWGFLMLVQQYLAYSGLGIQYAVNAELATTKNVDTNERSELIGSSLLITTIISLIVFFIGLGIQSTGYPLFEKFNFNDYVLSICAIVSLYNLQQLFTNIYRVYGKLTHIAGTELISAIVPLVTVLIFKDSPELINLLLGSLILSGLISNLIFLFNMPCKVIFRINNYQSRRLIAMGIPLLIYNFSHQLITTSGRTLVSNFYSLEDMGYYSFSNNITTGVMLGLNAVSWVFFPNILSRTHADIPNDEVFRVVEKIKDLYNISVFLVVFIVILISPLLFTFLPQFRQSLSSLNILLLAQAVLSASYGYNCVAIARKQQMKVAGISGISAVFVVASSWLIGTLKGGISWIAVAVLAGAFLYTFLQANLGTRLIDRKVIGISALISTISWGSLLSIIILLVGILTGHSFVAGLLGLSVFILSNWQKIKLIPKFVYEKS
jgi:O-antigen/teichoic acid export membrane protein